MTRGNPNRTSPKTHENPTIFSSRLPGSDGIRTHGGFKRLSPKAYFWQRHNLNRLAAWCFLTIPAYGSVTILSQEYHCSGETYWGIPETGYSYTDSIPVSGSVFDDWGGASSSAWKYGAMAGTGASSEWASASSTFVFTVAKPTLIIEVLGSLYSTAFPDTQGGISYLLTDSLTSAIIGGRSWSLTDNDISSDGYGWGLGMEDSVTCNLVTGNGHRLFISANVTNANGTDAYIETILIPEPSPLVLSVIVGTGGLVLRRRN